MQHFKTNFVITVLYLIIFLLLLLFLISVAYSKESSIHIFIVTALTFVACFAFAKALFRRLTIDDKGLSYSMLKSKRYIAFEDIEDIHILNGLGRFVLIITSQSGAHIVVSSLFSRFDTILEQLKPHANEAEQNALNNALILLKRQARSYIFLMVVIIALLIYVLLNAKIGLWRA